MPVEPSGKVILLTVGADGIGPECAAAYVREGAAVVVVDRDGEKATEAAAHLGSDCMAARADVGERPADEAAIHAVLARYGKLHSVHNNAGIASPSKTGAVYQQLHSAGKWRRRTGLSTLAETTSCPDV